MVFDVIPVGRYINAPFLMVFPGTLLILTVLAFNLLGELAAGRARPAWRHADLMAVAFVNLSFRKDLPIAITPQGAVS